MKAKHQAAEQQSNTQSAPPADRLISPAEIMRQMNIGKTKFYFLVRHGVIPAPIRLGTRTTRWRASDIDRLIASGFQSEALTRAA